MTSHVTTTSVEELHKVSKLHENNLVIELGIDRIVTWLGVYFIFILGVLLEVEEVFGSGRGLSCFPENYINAFTQREAELASLNCWEISSTSNYAHYCLQGNSSTVNQADYAKLNTVTLIIKLLPLLLIFQAFLTSLPTVWWHFNFGSRLLAHLKLIQFLLDKICEAINDIKHVEYNGKPYDSKSAHFIGKMPFSDPGIKLALQRMALICLRLESRQPYCDDSYYKTLIESIRDNNTSLCKSLQNLTKKASDETHQEYQKVRKTFLYTQKILDEEPLDKNTRSLLENRNYIYLKRLCMSSLEEIDKDEILPIKIIAKYFSENETSITINLTKYKFPGLSKFRAAKIGDKVNLNEVETAKQILSMKENIKGNKEILENMEILENGTKNLYELQKLLETLCICLQSLDRKLKVEKESKMQDRHFLSLLCYENFASLYYIPYIHLVFRVYGIWIYAGITNVAERNRKKELDVKEQYDFYTRTKPTLEAALMSWCHPDNMTARRLVFNYLKKQYLTMFIAFVGILLFGCSFILIRILVNDSSQNLHCALPHICLICSLLRETRLYILIVTACCSYVVTFSMLCHQVVNFNKHIQTNDCHLFELLQDLSMDALNTNENKSAAVNSSSTDMQMSIKSDTDEKRTNTDVLQENGVSIKESSQSATESPKNSNTVQEKKDTAVTVESPSQIDNLFRVSRSHKISFR